MTALNDEQKEYLSRSFNSLDLSGKEISSKVFDGCTFRDCDFSDAILNNSVFVDCHFVECNLSLVKLDNSRFSDVLFDECKVIGIDWTMAAWPRIALCSPIKFYKCILNDCSFFGLDLEEIVMQGCKAHEVDFREANFSQADLSYTDCSNSLFNETNLTGANFIEAANYNINIYFNDIKDAKFSRYEAVSLLESLDIELVD